MVQANSIRLENRSPVLRAIHRSAVWLFRNWLLALILFWPAAGPALFSAVILISAMVSHAPAWVRHYRPLRGRMLERPASERRRSDT